YHHAADSETTDTAGQGYADAGADICLCDLSHRHGNTAAAGQPAQRLAHTGVICWLCHHLYRLSETRHAAEHCHRRLVRRNAAATGLDCCYRNDRFRWSAAGADNLCVDAAALLAP